MKLHSRVWLSDWMGLWRWSVFAESEGSKATAGDEGTTRTRAEARKARNEAKVRVREAWRILTGEET
jgi:hypothetical protein